MKPYFTHLLILLKRLGIALLIFSICRILFYIFNSNHFSEVSFDLFIFGIRFDLVAISYLFLPFIFFSIIPFSFRNFRKYQLFLSVLFYLGNTIGIVLNLVDLAYFDFTLKRSTTDLFSIIGADDGKDFFKLLHLYIVDFWYDYMLLIGLVILSYFLYKKYGYFKKNFYPYNKKDYLLHTLIFIIGIASTIIGTRGGLQYKPISIINAGQYTASQNTSIVLNTPFTILKTLFNDNIQTITYYSNEELGAIYSPVISIKNNAAFKNKNVVLIILESFAKEYVGALNNETGYTPFIDSLIKKSYVFNNAYANGYKSIESLPSILAGLPSLMNKPFLASNYSGNQINGLPFHLKEMGYHTSFYHSGSNGTMGFNGFVGACGIDNYHGLNEYPTPKKDYDGSWGIFDEPYFQYFADELNHKPEPFFSSIFTISSHHPYTIPKEHAGRFPKGDLPLHETIGYTDYALKKFFETIKKMAWYNNTLFLFTADHSARSRTSLYKNRLGRFAIPAFIFDPSEHLIGENNEIFQQTDILPSILGIIGTEKKIISFGNNAFDSSQKFIVNYVNSSYQIATQDYFLIFDGQQSTGLFNLKNDPFMKTNLINIKVEEEIKDLLESKLKAIIQQYNNRMINNNLSIE